MVILFGVKHIVWKYATTVVSVRNLYLKALPHVVLEVNDAHLVETGFQRHLTSYELLTVRTVVVDNLLAVDEQARAVVGSNVEAGPDHWSA